MAEVSRLLSTTRLLTLTGPGGCGKTRLGIEVAASLLATGMFTDGIWLVELAPLDDPTLLSQLVASALSIREASGRPLTETLLAYLGPKSALLILDNCEHLVYGCAHLAQTVLSTCPELKILATSREALNIPGETLWLVPSLSLPAPETLHSTDKAVSFVQELIRYEAIRLFVERAAAGLTGFSLSQQNALAVAQICQRLDGIPLALELAAARVKVLSVEQIAGRLDDSLRLLTAGSRISLLRQQTLRATIEWSYNLLSEQERALFRQLAVFAGGFTLMAAEGVCGGEQVEKEAVLDLLSQLVDKSLVVRQARDGEARYHFLETIRQYARSLLEAEELAGLQQKHAKFFLALAEAIEPKLNDPDRHTWLERLEIEHDNLRAALQWAVGTREAEGQAGFQPGSYALPLAGALWWFWFHRGYWSEGRKWFAQALATGGRVGALATSEERAKALLGAGMLAWAQGDHPVARSQLEESVALYRQLSDQQNLGQALQFLGQEFLGQGDLVLARSLAAEAVQIFRQTGDLFGLAVSLVTEGIAAQLQGESTAAQSFLAESVALSRQTGDKWALGLALRNLGYLALREGDYDQAAALQRESLAVLRDLGEKWFISRSLEALAEAVSMQGDYERAARLFGASEALREAIGASVLAYYQTEYEQSLAAARAGLDEAAFASAWAEGRARPLEEVISYAIEQGSGGAKEKILPHTLTLSHPSPPATKPELRFFALGSAQVYRDQAVITAADWGYAKPKVLLFYLLCHPSRTKAQIGLDLWPDASPVQLRRSFHVTLHHLRRVLGRPEWIIFENQHYAFNRSLAYWFDVEAFEANLAEARRFQPHERAQAIPYLEAAVKLYRGDFLEDSVDGDWYLLRREELGRMILDALLTLGQLLFAAGGYTEAADIYRQAIAHDNLLEAAHRELLRCYARLGERGQALRHYQTLVELLYDELGLPPSPETTALFERLRRGEAIE